ncbi:YkoF family thiamine/hydroxymethylpyrimidine-binding protein [Rubrimonas cliftonensis]|uniref:YKOF-related Family n=1 Tax=Rubrimonas cliftonensis TaxID=89524 RepID=A0A1H4CCN2_9RHOB|nr:YkoF family thiamine/hydroxymethylpyrimidine-binding protein [Rubrimonas cliftonensis]SEA58059.1 YKOF-related Family [Rubrimonas cliftonensis]
MFSGAQLSLHPMRDDFIAIILDAIGALEPWRSRLRIETDDVSTLVVGPPEALFPAMRDLFVRAAASEAHCVLHATVSRGCPGEPDDPICAPGAARPAGGSMAERVAAAAGRVAGAQPVGRSVAAQFSLYPLGAADASADGMGGHMAEIMGCIDFLKASGCFERSKNFCTKLRGDAGPVFATLAEAFTSFGAPDGHVAMDATVSANSPSAA